MFTKSVVNSIFLILYTILLGSIVFLKLLWLLQILQIEEYYTKKFYLWLFKNWKKVFLEDFALVLLIVLNIVFFTIWKNETKYTLLTQIIFILIAGITFVYNLFVGFKRQKYAKKKLVFTKRLIRLFLANTIFLLGFYFVLTKGFYSCQNFSWVLPCLLILLLPFIIMFVNLAMLPIEESINNFYFEDAKRKLGSLNPFIVAVTGSYGKTSTKYFIAQILQSKYNVLMTPESYNTAMGITKVIRLNLNPEHKIFVVELAENEKGGFKRLLNLINPNVSVVTSVGIQHLEEFETEEKIKEAIGYFVEKSIESEKCKAVVLNADIDIVSQIESKNSKVKKCSIDTISDFYAKQVKISPKGTKFYLYKKNGERVLCTTKILGKENVRNIVLASSVADVLGFSIEEISRAIENLHSPPHRLELIDNGTGILIIDDAYNSNPVGARMAADVLSEFTNGRKILVTPGLVELGKLEYEENKKIGQYFAKRADYVFLVGKERTKPIYEGLLQENFPQDKIFINANLGETTEVLKSFLKAGDSILFENDLPDTYEEI
jgi:UDP-N-acetylmuramoyl-tripeptide--D-alanyl-D-alanine ligase